MFKQCRHVKFKGTRTKWPVQKTQNSAKHAEHENVTDIQNELFFCVFLIFLFKFCIYDFLNDFAKKYWLTALVRSMNFIKTPDNVKASMTKRLTQQQQQQQQQHKSSNTKAATRSTQNMLAYIFIRTIDYCISIFYWQRYYIFNITN